MFKIKKAEGPLGPATEFYFSGKLDTAACADHAQKILDTLRGFDGRVVFNLTAVEYVSSAFLRICLEASKTAGKDKFMLVDVPPHVMKVLKISGLDTQLTVQ